MTNEEREKEIRKQPIPTKEECIAFYEEATKLSDVRFVPYYKMAIKALEIELLTDTEQRIFLKAIRREREVCQKVDDEYPDNDSKVSLVKICDSIERKVKKIWE